MVDLLGMFRRRPAKRSAPGFARSRADITALGDGLGEMLHNPVRDAPPIARDAPLLAAGTAARGKAEGRKTKAPAEDKWRRAGASAVAAAGLSGCA